MTAEHSFGLNVIPLISILIALIFFANAFASIGSKNDIRTGFIGFLVLIAIVVTHLFRLIRKKGNWGINSVVALLCLVAAVVIGYHLLSTLTF